MLSQIPNFERDTSSRDDVIVGKAPVGEANLGAIQQANLGEVVHHLPDLIASLTMKGVTLFGRSKIVRLIEPKEEFVWLLGSVLAESDDGQDKPVYSFPNGKWQPSSTSTH